VTALHLDQGRQASQCRLSFTDVGGAACVTKISCKKPGKCYSFGVAEKTLRFKVVIPKVKSLASSKKIKAAVKSVRDGKK
jgi:hypothetical protein